MAPAAASRHDGIALPAMLLMLFMILLLGLSAARTSLQSEKAARNDRDRQIALQAAEAGLLDAERDIQEPGLSEARNRIFADGSSHAFPAQGCAHAEGNPDLGLCATAAEGVPSVWTASGSGDGAGHAAGVPYGRFTGRRFAAGGGPLPAEAPRYVIEALADRTPGLYRITAIGYGMRRSTRVVLQSHFRRAPASKALHRQRGRSVQEDSRQGRLGWREIINWEELRHAHPDH